MCTDQIYSCTFHKKIDKKLTFLKTIDSFYYLGYNHTYTKLSSRQETAIFYKTKCKRLHSVPSSLQNGEEYEPIEDSYPE